MTPQQPVSPGWQVVSAQGDRTAGRERLLIAPKSNTIGVISDIDDTVLISNVPDKSQLLKNTWLKNVVHRRIPCDVSLWQVRYELRLMKNHSGFDDEP